MNISPIDFLLAKTATDYYTTVFGVELEEDLYNFHIYNLALQFSLTTGRSDDLILHMASKDGFLNTIQEFSGQYYEMLNAAGE